MKLSYNMSTKKVNKVGYSINYNHLFFEIWTTNGWTERLIFFSLFLPTRFHMPFLPLLILLDLLFPVPISGYVDDKDLGGQLGTSEDRNP